MDKFKIVLLYFSFGLSFFFARGQQIGNYVSNGSFEVIDANALSNYEGALYWKAIDTTNCFSYFLINYPNPATGFQYPRTGTNFIISSFYCTACNISYVKNRLKTTLKSNATYCAKYYVVNTNNNRIAIDKYGMYFENGSLDTIKSCDNPLTFLNPQIENTTGIITDTLNWIAITGTFVAKGNEKFVVLGNFRSIAMTNTLLINTPTLQPMSNDIYIDDVSVIEVNLPAYAGPDKLIYPGDSVYIGREKDFAIDPGCIWYKLPNMTTALDTISGLWVKPSVTSTYVVRQELDCSSVKWDTVVVL